MISILILAAVIATTYTLGKVALLASPPIFLIGTRLLVAGICFGVYYGIRYRVWPRINKKEWWLLLQITFTGFFAGFILEFWALQYLTSGKTALLYSLSPFVAALFSYFIFKEKVNRKKLIGILIGLIGFIPAVVTRDVIENGGSILSWPEIAILCAVLCFAYSFVLMRKLLKETEISESFIISFGMISGGIASMITSYLTEWDQGLPITNMPSFLWATAGLIIMGNILGYILYAYTLRHYTATLMTFGEMLIPIFAAIYGWVFLAETVSIYFFVSLALFLTGMYIFYQEEKRLGYFMEQ